MDEIGTVTIETDLNRTSDGISRLVRIAHADSRTRFQRGFLDAAEDDRLSYAHLDGDVLTIRDDYGQRYIYRIRWDDYADGGYLAEWPD